MYETALHLITVFSKFHKKEMAASIIFPIAKHLQATNCWNITWNFPLLFQILFYYYCMRVNSLL